MGAYSIARAFHEAYHINSIVMSTVPTGPVHKSTIIINVIEQNMRELNAIKNRLVKIEKSSQNIPKILIGSDDWHVELIIKLKNYLGKEWIIPYISYDLFKMITDKSRFYDICEQLDIDCPKTIVVNMKEFTDIPFITFNYPVVVKPSNSVEYQSLNFLGKKKAYIVYNETELRQIIHSIKYGGYQDKLLVQEFIPGDDTAMHVLTCYSSTDRIMKFASMGQTLLEDHTPGGIGNPLAILTANHKQVINQAEKLLNNIGYLGYSNFDIKFDWRDRKFKFFEINARLGRSNYYVTGQRHNIAKYYVEDFIQKRWLNFSIGSEEILFTLVPKHLLIKNLKGNEVLIQKVKDLYNKGEIKHPLRYYPTENNIKRKLYEISSTMNYYLKFKKHPRT
ncbi:hypothetical protein IIU_06068 [Bacillus cereus VD133]|uniref:ATP-grasp domain-containing protein n=1 Tax=Bacillus cereus VD133 TaxID=1053233 RepID=A0A9W5PKX9_BACCE|nr:ATP-grasp domain-containing protein [Bacillus cereus]EOO25857.1 hypothetical protein IIU_06068 [Bacillus cereus VD133]